MSINGNFYPIRTERLAVCRGDKCRQTLANAKFNALRETSNGVNKKVRCSGEYFRRNIRPKCFAEISLYARLFAHIFC